MTNDEFMALTIQVAGAVASGMVRYPSLTYPEIVEHSVEIAVGIVNEIVKLDAEDTGTWDAAEQNFV
jgi:hypothetical protein